MKRLFSKIVLVVLKKLSAASSYRRDEDSNPPALFLLGSLTPAWFKRVKWNFKYRKGKAPYGRSPASFVKYIVSHYASTTRLLDVGCGSGTFLQDLREAGWTGHYTGLDISARAINDAKRDFDNKADWIVSDVESFKPDGYWEVICFIESIYYVPVAKLLPVLRCLAEHLTEEGSIVMRLGNLSRHIDHMRELGHCCGEFEIKTDAHSIVRITRSQLLY
jgi:SAM-dependent methyltransferase